MLIIDIILNALRYNQTTSIWYRKAQHWKCENAKDHLSYKIQQYLYCDAEKSETGEGAISLLSQWRTSIHGPVRQSGDLKLRDVVRNVIQWRTGGW